MSSEGQQSVTSNNTTPSSNLFKVAATIIAITAVILALYNPLKTAFLRQLPKTQTVALYNTTKPTMASASPLEIVKRPCNARGHPDHTITAGSIPSTHSHLRTTTTLAMRTSGPFA